MVASEVVCSNLPQSIITQTRSKSLGIPDVFPEHGSVRELQELVGISSEEIRKTLQNIPIKKGGS